MNRDPYPKRKTLPHDIPFWVSQGAKHLITVNCSKRGINQLCHNDTGKALIDSAKVYDSLSRWYMMLMVVMPDHVHIIAVFNQEYGIKRIISAWKGYQTKRLGIEWQANFFEHRIRNDEQLVEKLYYVRMNPVRKNLVESSDMWPYLWDRT